MTLERGVLLDSGAFSSWKRGISLSVNDYIDFCKRHKHEVDSFVNLDCIPGKDGKMDHSQSSIEQSAAKSYETLQEMKAAGLSPIPVFHQGERFYWLDRMLEEGETYVGISPYMRAHQNEIVEWMDKCFTRITDGRGKPLIKTHGFGVTSARLCVRYPWFSVDSTSWSVGGGYGTILVPKLDAGAPDYSRPPLNLRISARKQDQSGGFDGLSQAQQDAVRNYAAQIGVSMSELRNTFYGRWKFNVRYHLGMAETCKGNLFKNRLRSMFDKSFTDREGYDPEPMRMYFATVFSDEHCRFLNEQGIRNRLLSYAFLKDEPDEFLEYYLKTGYPLGHKEKKARPKRMSVKTYSNESYRVKRAQNTLERASRPDDSM